jgi:hypothetical protein
LFSLSKINLQVKPRLPQPLKPPLHQKPVVTNPPYFNGTYYRRKGVHRPRRPMNAFLFLRLYGRGIASTEGRSPKMEETGLRIT